MISAGGNTQQQTTTHKVVLPFYIYAALSFFAATILLFFSTSVFHEHYFQPHTLAITHLMALGWGTMIILGSSHQLVPVLIESRLYSNWLAILTFILTGAGILLFIPAFYYFNLGWPSILGGAAVNLGILIYLINIGMSISNSKTENVHAVFVFTSAAWLFLTTLFGFFLLLNFSYNLFSQNSLYYLPLHAHLGIVGWFLLLILGVGSRLIPMFLISKYENPRLLWLIFGLLNLGLVLFLLYKIYLPHWQLAWLPVLFILTGVLLFGYYCLSAYRKRIRRSLDKPMQLSLLSVAMLFIPFAALMAASSYVFSASRDYTIVLTYGFCIFFGWITAIILGMTFKTLPFIIWNKVYHHRAGSGKSPNPKDLFSDKLFKGMSLAYVAGFILFIAGLLWQNDILLKSGAAGLMITALLYNLNTGKLLLHKP